MRRAAKKDSNHNEIAGTFRQLGWSWTDTHQLGNGFPDGAAGKNNRTLLVEIKDGSLPPSARKLTPMEQTFHDRFKGAKAIVESVDDVIRINNEHHKELFA